MRRKEALILLVLFVLCLLIALKLLQGHDIKGMGRIIGAAVALVVFVAIKLIKKVMK